MKNSNDKIEKYSDKLTFSQVLQRVVFAFILVVGLPIYLAYRVGSGLIDSAGRLLKPKSENA